MNVFQFFIIRKRTNNANVKLCKKRRKFQKQLLHYLSKSDWKQSLSRTQIFEMQVVNQMCVLKAVKYGSSIVNFLMSPLHQITFVCVGGQRAREKDWVYAVQLRRKGLVEAAKWWHALSSMTLSPCPASAKHTRAIKTHTNVQNHVYTLAHIKTRKPTHPSRQYFAVNQRIAVLW